MGIPVTSLTSMPASNQTSYNLGFTASSLRPDLARIVAECYLAVGDWDLAKDKVLASNALQSRTISSARRQEREIRRRLQRLTPDQITLLAQATTDDRAAMAWLAVLKSIRFAFEFAAEVLREKLATHDPVLRHSDYESYVELQSVSHADLARLSNTSKIKVRQVLLSMLKEVGILTSGAALGTIQRPVLSPAVLNVIQADSPRWLAGYLVPDTEIGVL